MERIVGQRLVERPGGPKPVSLTEAGRLLLTHADAIAARVAAAQADLTALADGQAGTLRVGVFQSVGQRILPELMRRFLAAWPQVKVTLTESADDAELLGLVERGELDLTFADLPLVDGPFDAVELMRDPYVLVVPADSAARRAGHAADASRGGGARADRPQALPDARAPRGELQAAAATSSSAQTTTRRCRHSLRRVSGARSCRA